jgi:hypothetical protein
MKKAYLLIIFLTGLVVLLSVVKAVLQNSLSTSGIYLSKAQQEINYYKTQNAILSEKLLTASSLTTIISKASESGFTGGNNMMVIKTSSPLAVRP